MDKNTNEYRIQILRDKRDALNAISPSFCSAKWLQTTAYLQNGFNHSCHHPSAHKVSLAELKENPMALINSAHKKEQRKLMKQGTRPSECDYCWRIEDMPGEHFSDRHFKSADDEWAWPFLDDIKAAGADDDFLPSYLEISFSNVCNFKCAYCGPDISSQWAAELKQFGPYPVKYAANLDWMNTIGKTPYLASEQNPYLEAFWEIFPAVLEKLTVFRITGGEPLLSKDFWKMLDFLISYDRHISIGINTNLGVDETIVAKLIEKINALSKIHTVFVFTSIESTGKHAEYVRYGLDYELWSKNCQTILDNTPQAVSLTIMTTVNALSLSTFSEFIDVVMTLRKKYNPSSAENRIGLSINYLRWPHYLQATILPQEIKDDYCARIQQTADFWLKYTDQTRVERLYLEEYDQVMRLLKFINSDDDSNEHGKDFANFIIEYDRRKKTNFKSLFPELSSMIDKYSDV